MPSYYLTFFLFSFVDDSLYKNNLEDIMKKLSSDEIQREINKLNGWTITDNAINKEYKLKDFTSALSFINNIGEEAETMNHHPDLFLHSYNKVKITLSTHSEGGLTMNDFNLANKIESIYNK